ncbi:MAG TPA: NnrS family protein [Roseiarcus sp.]|nr:NnrS family protein [Roseiarcus sp.]
MTSASPHFGSVAAGRLWRGAAMLSRGFRPFFFAAGAWAVIGMGVWPPFFEGRIEVPTAFSPVDWHAHEMIFGYVGAVIAGFLLTATPNWTGRLPVVGLPLMGLAALWAAGRIAVFLSAEIGRVPAALIDAAFLAVFACLIGREVMNGRDRRNLKVVGLVLALALDNVAFHIEDARFGLAEFSTRAALGLIVMLILLIGGRVAPSFTNNWLARMKLAERPAPFSKADAAILALSAAALALWIAAPEGVATGALALLAGAANLWRLSRWQGIAARRDALVFVLHAGFFFAAAGFLVAGAGALWPSRIPYAAGVHVWAIGAIGVMTLAMMTRATLGHSGRPLVASGATQAAYLCVVVALVARLAMAVAPQFASPMMDLAAGAWMLAFALFLFIYGPILMHRRGPA